MRRVSFGLILIATVICSVGLWPAHAAGTWMWPVSGPIVRGFDPPASPYGSGHRGIDVASSLGTVVIAPAAGQISFAGKIGGHLFVTIDHGAGLESTYSWLSSIAVKKGDVVEAGDTIAATGPGHATDVIPTLHMGVKLHDVYVDPLDYLGPVSVSGFIRLAA
ncbi:MAG TPA: M23 family metallopeptidase [Actinomycetota bacterium]